MCHCVCADGWNDGPRVDVYPTIGPGTHKMPFRVFARAKWFFTFAFGCGLSASVFFFFVSTESAPECLKMDWSTSAKIHSSFSPNKTIYSQRRISMSRTLLEVDKFHYIDALTTALTICGLLAHSRISPLVSCRKTQFEARFQLRSHKLYVQNM